MSNRKSNRDIHQHLLDIAAGLSPKLVDALQQVGPVKLRRRHNLTLTETLCRTVAGQQLSVKAATTIWQRVLQAAKPAELTCFIDSADASELRECGLSQSKAKAMKAIVAATKDGILCETTLSKATPEERVLTLTSIWGVGQWTADMMNLFFYASKDIWPNGDLAVTSTLQRLTSKRRSTFRTAQKFAPYRSYLAISMYEVVNQNLCLDY